MLGEGGGPINESADAFHVSRSGAYHIFSRLLAFIEVGRSLGSNNWRRQILFARTCDLGVIASRVLPPLVISVFNIFVFNPIALLPSFFVLL